MSQPERRLDTLNGVAKAVVATKQLACAECEGEIYAGHVYVSSTRSRRDSLGKLHHTTRRYHPHCAEARIKTRAVRDTTAVLEIVSAAHAKRMVS